LLGCVCEGDDAAFGDLVQDGGTCVMSSCQISGPVDGFLEFFPFESDSNVIWAWQSLLELYLAVSNHSDMTLLSNDTILW